MRIGWFSTGRDEAARNLLTAVHDGLNASGAPAKIDWIFCHREPGDGPDNEEARQRKLFLDLAADLGIPVKALSHVRFEPEMRRRGLEESISAEQASPRLEEWRNLYGEQVMKVVGDDPCDIVVMAGYMLIIGDPELAGLNLVNIHPALPWGPKGTWQEVIHELIAQEAREQGIMIHLVTKELDRGPVISYCRFPIRGRRWEDLWGIWRVEIMDDTPREEREAHPLFREIREFGEVRELPLLSAAITEIAQGRIEIRDKRIFTAGKPLEQGVDLTETIEDAVRVRWDD
jgi:phosphoribosylglycinamide formyltransferase-1